MIDCAVKVINTKLLEKCGYKIEDVEAEIKTYNQVKSE